MPKEMIWSDSLEQNVATAIELVGGLSPAAKERAKYATRAIQSTLNKLRNEHPRDSAVVLGTMYAIFKTAENILAAERESDKTGESIIQLLQ